MYYYFCGLRLAMKPYVTIPFKTVQVKEIFGIGANYGFELVKSNWLKKPALEFKDFSILATHYDGKSR
jgi:hypothetical protein